MNLKLKAACILTFFALFSLQARACDHTITVDSIAVSPDNTVAIGDTVDFSIREDSPYTYCSYPGCSIDSYSWSAPGGTPSSGSGSSFSCKFGTAGTKTVTVTAECDNGYTGTAEVDIEVVSVDRVILDGSDPEELGPITQSTSIATSYLKAFPNPSTASFPTGEPTWTMTKPPGSSATVDNTGMVTDIDLEGAYVITAKCGSADTGKTFTINAEYTYDKLKASDASHSGRYCYEGETLYLVGHNDATINAQGGFGSGEPTWSGVSSISAGTTSFTTNSSSDETISGTACGETKTVTVERIQQNNNTLASPTWGCDSTLTNMQDKLNFKVAGASLTINYPTVSASGSWENAEVADSPSYGTQYKFDGNLNGFSVTGRITHPTYSGSLFGAEWELYAQATGSLNASADVTKPPEQSWNGSVEVTGGVDVEVGWYTYIPAGVLQFEGELSAGTGVSGTIRLNDGKVEGKASWSGVTGDISLTLETTGGTDICSYSGSVALIDSKSTDWKEFCDLDSLFD